MNETPEYLWRRAQTYRANGRDREAYALLLELSRRWPTVEVYTALAQLATELGEVAVAYGAYRRALQRQPEDLAALRGLAELHTAQGRHEDAASVYLFALKHHPNVPEIHLNLGSTLGRLGQMEEAELCFWNAFRLAGKDSPLAGTILYNLARVYAVIDHHAAAVSFLLAASAKDRRFAVRACLDDIFLETAELQEFRKVLLVATPFLTRRLSEIANRNGIDALRRFLRNHPIVGRAVDSERSFSLIRRRLREPSTTK